MFNVWDSRGQLIIILLIYLERTTSCICGEVCSLIFEAEKATSSMFFGSRFAVQHWGGKDCYQVCPNDGDTQTQADYFQNLLLPVLTDWASEQNAKCSCWFTVRDLVSQLTVWSNLALYPSPPIYTLHEITVIPGRSQTLLASTGGPPALLHMLQSTSAAHLGHFLPQKIDTLENTSIQIHT